MTLDGFTLYFIVEELKKMAAGCKVDKVHQPQPDTVILVLRSSGSGGPKNLKLLISAGAADSRIHTTDRKFENPKSPPNFCMFLRKYLTGAKILSIAQTGLERIVDIVFETKDELGLPHTLTLTAELMGKYSNIILRNENNIIMDSLRHVTQAQSRVRSVLPSLVYERPKSEKLNPMEASEDALVEALNKRGGKDIKNYLSASLQGVSGQTADEILFRCKPSYIDALPGEKLARCIKAFFSVSEPEPILYFYEDGAPFFYSPVIYGSVSAARIAQEGSVNQLADKFYGIQIDIHTFAAKREALQKRVSKHLDKLYSLLQKQLDAVENSKRAESYKNNGDIITANIYRISKGMETLFAQDYITDKPVEIRLDPRLSPAANAQANYRKYSKLKSGLDIIVKRMLDTKEEIAFLESVLVSLDSSENLDELSEIEVELFKTGLLTHTARNVKMTEKPSEPHKFLSSEGYTFYAGKNNRQNDVLTMKTAAADDMWLHTKDIPGSHVIITGIREELPRQTLFEAATIAATISKAKGSSKVAVDYTRRKNVHKPVGAKPGMVIYEHYNTIIVDPDRELFNRLLVRK